MDNPLDIKTSVFIDIQGDDTFWRFKFVAAVSSLEIRGYHLPSTFHNHDPLSKRNSNAKLRHLVMLPNGVRLFNLGFGHFWH